MVLEDLEDLMETVAKGCRHYARPPPARGTPAARLHALSGHVNARRQANTPSANCYTCTRACHVAASGVEVADELTAEVIYGDDTDVASGPNRWRSKQKFFEWKQFLPEEEARAVVELAQRFGVWHMHSEGEVLSIGYGAGEGVASLDGVDVPDPATFGTKHFPGEPGPAGRVLNEDGTEWIFPHRFDMGICLGPLRDADGMLYGRPNDQKGTSRTNFFRESFMYGVAGDPGNLQYFGEAPELAERVEKAITAVMAPAARELYGKPIIEPNVLYCNMLRPGEEIGTHSDVPEFRGINRLSSPSWLVVLCHMSNLFEDYRVHSATGISYYQDVKQGRMASYHGIDPEAPGHVHPAVANSAILLDTDSTYHHTDRVAHHDFPAQPEKAPGTTMRYDSDEDKWVVVSPDGERLMTHEFDGMRMSVSWKAQCFATEEDRQKYKDHSDDLTKDMVFEALTADLRARGIDVPEDRGELIKLCLKTYVTEFPRPEAVAETWAAVEESSFHLGGSGTDVAAAK